MRSLITLVTLTLLFVSCANMTAPSGGEGDTVSPVLLEAKPSSRSVAIPRDTKFEFSFSEWVNPKTVAGAITIHPHLDSGFTTKVTTRTVTVIPNDLLDSNQTYHVTISGDLTDFSGNGLGRAGVHIYSTGAKIDTGHISGCIPPKLTDAQTPKVALFTKESVSASDSSLLGPADYLTQADTLGRFTFEALKPGEYCLIGFIDTDKDNQITPGEIVYLGSNLSYPTGTDSVKLIEGTSSTTHDYLSEVRIISPREIIATLSRPQPSSPFLTIALSEKQDDSLAINSVDTLHAEWLDSLTIKIIVPYDLVEEKRYMLMTTARNIFSGDSVQEFRTDTLTNKGNISLDTTAPTATKVYWETHTPKKPKLFIEWSMPVLVCKDTLSMKDTLDNEYLFVIERREGKMVFALPTTELPLGQIFTLSLPDSLVKSYNGISCPKDSNSYTFELPEENSLTDEVKLFFPAAQSVSYAVLFWEILGKGAIYKSDDGVFTDVLPGEYTAKAYFDINKNGIYDRGTLFPFSQGDVFYHFEETIHAHPRFKVEHIVPPLIICEKPKVVDTTSSPKALPAMEQDTPQ